MRLRRIAGLSLVLACGAPVPASAAIVYVPWSSTPHDFVSSFSNLCLRQAGDQRTVGLRVIIISSLVHRAAGPPLRVGSAQREWIFVQSSEGDGQPVLASGQVQDDHLEIVWQDSAGLRSLRGDIDEASNWIDATLTVHAAGRDIETAVTLRPMSADSEVPVCGAEPPRPPPGTDTPTLAPGTTP
jgi:hypothetical protein